MVVIAILSMIAGGALALGRDNHDDGIFALGCTLFFGGLGALLFHT